MTIISVDWSIKKPLYYFDGKEVKATHNPKDIKADIVLVETGAPYSLVSQLNQNNTKILVVSGEETSKYRESVGIEKTDENDVKIIMELYKLSPELYKEFEQRNITENELLYHKKMFLSYKKAIVKLKNESKALEKEYIVSNKYEEIISYLERTKESHVEKMGELANYLYNNEVGTLRHTKLMGELNCSIFVSLVDIRKFNSVSKFIAYCGFAPKDIRRYDKNIKNLVWTSCDSIVIKHRLEPYRSLYDNYKERKLKEGKKKAHAHKLAMRKVCQRILTVIYKKLKNTKNDRNQLDEMFKINIPKQRVEGIEYKDNSITIKLKKDNKGQAHLFDY